MRSAPKRPNLGRTAGSRTPRSPVGRKPMARGHARGNTKSAGPMPPRDPGNSSYGRGKRPARGGAPTGNKRTPRGNAYGFGRNPSGGKTGVSKRIPTGKHKAPARGGAPGRGDMTKNARGAAVAAKAYDTWMTKYGRDMVKSKGDMTKKGKTKK